MAELVDAADSKSVFERSGSSILPRGTKIEKDLEIQGLFFRLVESERNEIELKSTSTPLVSSAFLTLHPICVARQNRFTLSHTAHPPTLSVNP